MVPFGSTASTQIRFLLQSLNDSNFDSVFNSLSQFIDSGLESSILLLQTCFDQHRHHEDNTTTKKNSIQDPNHTLLATIIRYLLSKPNFSTVLCEALRASTSNVKAALLNVSGFVLGPLLNDLEFTVSERIAFGLAFSDFEDVEVRSVGQSFCISHIEELCADNGNGSVIDGCSSERIQSIVLFLTRTEGVAKLVDSFIQMVGLAETKINGRSNDLVLSPLCNPDEMRQLELFYSENDEFDDILEEIEKEMSMADIVKELGYGCTVNVLHCKEVLSLLLPLTEVTISRILSTIACTHVVLEEESAHSTFCSALGLSSFDDPSLLSTWNVDVLIESINQLAPETDWIRVMENLDHEGLYFFSEDSFSFFMSVYRSACQDPFPLHSICGTVWDNAEGQISFLRYAVSASPEVFTFEHSIRQLVYVDAVHGHKLATGNTNQAWLCLDLLDVLCQLAEAGHAGAIRSILDHPLKHCPEVLLLGLSQTSTAYNLLQYEVLSTVFPMVVRNFSRAGVILHLWNINPNVVLRGLLDVQDFDLESMIKTFDICQELKILSPVLDMAPFSFSIKLAALASRKEQINLEKWLNDNLSTYGDTFFEGCLKFLKEIHVDVPQDVLQHSGAVVIAYLETVPDYIILILYVDDMLVAGASLQKSEDLKKQLASEFEMKDLVEARQILGESSNPIFSWLSLEEN